MKYVRNIEDLKRYTFEFFDCFLPQNISDRMVNLFLLGIGDEQSLIPTAINYLKEKGISENDAAEYGEAILQLNDYKDLLKRYIELLLKAQCYEQICAFLNRIFLQQIGDAKYKSSRRAYSINERYFDRFVEITIYCNIDKNLYTPFFLAIFNAEAKSKMFDYKEPLKEYLDIFLKEGDDENFISQLLNSDTKNGLSEYANKSTLKTLNALLQGYVDGEITNSAMIKQALIKHTQEGFNIIETLLQDDSEEVRYRATQLLLLITEDRRVKDRLKYLYENTKDAKIKALLEKECNFNSLKKFGSEGEFLSYVDNNVTQIQERLYGARLKRYYEENKLDNTGISGKTLTFIMDTFKSRDTDSQFIYLKEFFKYVDKNILSSLSKVVYDVAIYRDRLLSSKWALRLIAMFASKELLINMIKDLREWFLEKKTIAVGKYFLDLLAECGREELIDICKGLLLANLDKKQLKFIEEKLNQFSKVKKQNLEEVKDKLTEDYGFDNNGEKIIEIDNRTIKISINMDCSLSLTNVKTGKPARIKDDTTYLDCNLRVYLKTLEKEIKKQKKRLYAAFLEFRNYDTETFEECILSNNLLNYLSQGLIWARYKKDKFAEACLIENNKLVHLSGNVIFENFDEYTIALLQPCDCQENKERLKEKLNKPLLFDQLDFPVFNNSEISPNANSVDTLSGVFCNAQLFITRLQKLKYKINDLNQRGEYTTLVKENKNLNLITSVEFEKVVLGHENCSTTVSKIRFYELNKQTKSGKVFNLNKTDAMILKDINYRVLSNELAQVFIACKN